LKWINRGLKGVVFENEKIFSTFTSSPIYAYQPQHGFFLQCNLLLLREVTHERLNGKCAAKNTLYINTLIKQLFLKMGRNNNSILSIASRGIIECKQNE
jgi:hypothetical protein